MNVLAVVASGKDFPPLASNEELARIGDVPGISLRTVTDVTAQRVVHRLSLEQFDVLLWIGHGHEGLLLTQDGTIDATWMAAQLSSRRVALAVIAACETNSRPPTTGVQASQSFADALPAVGIDTITMRTSVKDSAVLEYDIELLRQLSSGTTLRMAHQVALNRAAQYGELQAPQLTPRDHQQGEKSIADARFYTTDTLLQGLDAKMDRLDTRYEDLERRMGTVEDDLKLLRSTPYRLYLLGGAVVMGLMLLLLIFIAWRLM